MNTYIEHQVIPCFFGTSLPESAFQDFYTLYIDGKEIGGGSELSYAHELAKMYGHENVKVLAEPVFTGFSVQKRRRIYA